ncbi:MAG: hypothetical protein AB1489_31535 [Acidobacteriota bacterium]
MAKEMQFAREESSAEAAHTQAGSDIKRPTIVATKWRIISIIAIIVLPLGGTLLFFQWRAERARHQQELQHQAMRMRYIADLKTMLESFEPLRRTIAMGASYHSYTLRLQEVVASTQVFLRSQPNDLLPPSRTEIKSSLDDYFLARECWKRKLELRLNFIDSDNIDKNARHLPTSDPLYQRVIERFPNLAVEAASQAATPGLDLDIVLRAAWRSADTHLAQAQALLAQDHPGWSH